MRRDLTGERFGRLTVVRKTDQRKHSKIVWECLCDCGETTFLCTGDLTSGNTRSCGCLQKEIIGGQNLIHGESRKGNASRLYYIWKNMRKRCNNSRGPDYKNYGGRGVSVCKRWNNFLSFREWAYENFYRDPIGEDKKYHLTIDRIDNDGDYCPENCEFVSKGYNSTKANLMRYGHWPVYPGGSDGINRMSSTTGLISK